MNIPYSTPLSHIDKIVVLSPSLYRMKHEFIPFDCLVVDECESVFADIFSGLCRGANFEFGMESFFLLMLTTPKIIFLDGFLKGSSLSVAVSFSSSLNDIRLVIGTYKIDRGTLWELPAPVI